MSQQTFLQSLGDKERREFLESNAADVYQGKYSRPLSDDEKTKAKDSLSQTFLKISDLEEDFAEKKAAHKEEIKPFKKEIQMLATQVRTGQMLADGIIFNLPDFESGFMESYNELGELISTRKLNPGEKQANVFSMGNTGN